MDHHDIKQQQQQQLQQILNQTFTNTGYVDQDIGQFINDPSGNYHQMFGNNHHASTTPIRRESIQSNKSGLSQHSHHSNISGVSSRKGSDQGSQVQQGNSAFKESFGSFDELNLAADQSVQQNDKNSVKTSQAQGQANDQNNPSSLFYKNLPQNFKRLDQYYRKYKTNYPLSQVKQKYPYFVISQPSYTLTKTYEQNIFQYNTLKNVNIQVMDVGYCTIADNFRIAIGTDDGRVAVFQKTYTKPVNIFQAFTIKKNTKSTQKQPQNNIKITSIQWSQNMQYLAVASDTKQLKVYQYKQSIQIQDKSILRMLKQPIQIISLSVKQIKNTIINIKFVSQLPFVAILYDTDDQIQILEYKINFMSHRPYLSKLPVKFNNVFEIAAIDFVVGKNKNIKTHKDQIHKFFNNQNQFVISGNTSINKNSKSGVAKNQQQYGTLIAVSSDQYVTIALLKPQFQVIMVYDKQKHGKNIKKQGYSHISFRKQPLGILIVWDKFAQLLNIEIQSLDPLLPRIRSSGTQLMPQTTLLAGLVTDTLVYQLSQSGIKIYCTANFGQEKDSSQFKQSIYQHAINFYQLPQGIKIQQQLDSNVPTIQVLRMLSSFVRVCHGWLFITSNTSLFSVRIQKFQQFIRNTIQNVNNWKIGLQLLHDGYLGKYKNYDNMTKQIIVKNIHQYSIKYINFLQMVIGNAQAHKIQENSSQKMLWAQETTFLFNILIQTQQYQHLLNRILPKLQGSNLSQFISSLQPFIMLHKLPVITPQGLYQIIKYIKNKDIVSILLIANIDPQLNQVDLPHMINQEILQNGMFEEMVALNMDFKDYFTPFAVMVSRYQAIVSMQSGGKQKVKNDLEILTELKMKSNQSQRSSTSEKSEEQTEQKQLQSQKQYQKQRLRSLIAYFTYKIFYKINNHEDIPSHATNTQRKKIIVRHKQFLQIFIPLFQSSIIQILLSSPEEQLALFQCIIPELFKDLCLQLINDISNKLFNTDLMSDIALGIPVSQVSNLKVYWMCLISLYNKSVIKMDVFMGLRYLANYGREEVINQSKIQEVQEKQQFKQQVPTKKNKIVKATKSQIKRSQRKAKEQIISSIQKFLKQTVQLSGSKIYEQFKGLSPELLQQFYNQLLSPNIVLKSSHIGLLRIVALILGSGFYIKVIHAMMSDMQTRRFDRRKSSMNANMKKQIRKSIDQNPKPRSNADILFDFIEQTVTKFNKKQKQQFKRILYENIQLFIELDCDRLCDLITNNYLQSINKFVSYNDIVGDTINRTSYTGIVIGGSGSLGNSSSRGGSPDTNSPKKNKNGSSGSINSITVHEYLLIRLIEGLLERLQSDKIQSRRIPMFQLNHQFMLDLRLKYLRLLALTGRQHQILVEVKKQNYPLDSSLDICRRYGVIDAEAYLLVKSGGQGQIASAIRLYFTLISEKIKFLTAESIAEFKDYFISIIKECIKVCQALHSTDSHFNQEWFLISEQLNDLKTNIYRILAAYTCDLLCDVIDKQVYPILAEKLVRNQNADGIINYLRESIDQLDLVFIRALLHQILKNYAFQKGMFLLTQQTYIESQLRQRRQIAVESTKGLVTTCTCYLCHESDGLIMHYNNCGHQIHPSCGQDVKTCIICACREEKMMQKQLDLLRKIKPEVYGKQNQLIMIEDGQIQKIRKQTALQKLKKYDQIKIDILYL